MTWNYTPWPDAASRMLGDLWWQELSASKIAARIAAAKIPERDGNGFFAPSRNAVVGRARRMGLPSRPSPIIRRK